MRQCKKQVDIIELTYILFVEVKINYICGIFH